MTGLAFTLLAIGGATTDGTITDGEAIDGAMIDEAVPRRLAAQAGQPGRQAVRARGPLMTRQVP